MYAQSQEIADAPWTVLRRECEGAVTVHLTPEEKLAAKKWRKYLKARKKELMVPLPKSLADTLGDIKHGTLVTVVSVRSLHLD
jgi:hypothetical protein